jgi:hypothetical protein
VQAEEGCLSNKRAQARQGVSPTTPRAMGTPMRTQPQDMDEAGPCWRAGGYPWPKNSAVSLSFFSRLRASPDQRSPQYDG